ncbi:DUF418 domain-containing protein [Roseivirga sp.]|uniref:DUF418 domain-containing protein n=1 Tax=Roseivirga sp. TaxID=1964215 RepID=UPI002B278E0D|nr:DUF418 domain-containing protein [Roseivirga sp.]
MAGTSYILQPIGTKNRVITLDILRGCAVLGILLMSIQSFSMPYSAYLHPLSFENLEGLNLYAWLISHVFANGKFSAMLAMLFGAGIIMISQKARKEHMRSSKLQYRRLFVLLLIGILHAYLLWFGDLLMAFSICGLFMFAFRSKSKAYLFKSGIIFLVVGSGLKLMLAYSIPFWEPGQFQLLESELWNPSAQEITNQISYYRGTWEQQMLNRVPDAFFMQTKIFFSEVFWKVSGLMLLGMAFYKKGVLIGKQSKKYLSKMFIYGIGLGLPLVVSGVLLDFHYRWSFELSYFYFSQFNYWGGVLMAIGYCGFIVLLCKISTRSFIAKSLSYVGRMSLSNYLMQSIICSFIFYGHGLSLYGDLDRSAQVVAVLALWVFQIVFSAIWLSYFQFGPFEWAWRSLSYGRTQPIRK